MEDTPTQPASNSPTAPAVSPQQNNSNQQTKPSFPLVTAIILCVLLLEIIFFSNDLVTVLMQSGKLFDSYESMQVTGPNPILLYALLPLPFLSSIGGFLYGVRLLMKEKRGVVLSSKEKKIRGMLLFIPVFFVAIVRALLLIPIYNLVSNF